MKKLAFLLTLIAAPAFADNCDDRCRAYIRGAVNVTIQTGETWMFPVCGMDKVDADAVVEEIAEMPTDFSVAPISAEFVIGYMKANYPCR